MCPILTECSSLSLYVAEYESDYSHIYGRLPLPTRFRHFPGGGGHGKRHVYVSEWE